MNLITLQYYTTVCETGSMAKAAKQLSLSRQALSKAILSLEDLVGIKLLKRNQSGTELTPAGEILYHPPAPSFWTGIQRLKGSSRPICGWAMVR